MRPEMLFYFQNLLNVAPLLAEQLIIALQHPPRLPFGVGDTFEFGLREEVSCHRDLLGTERGFTAERPEFPESLDLVLVSGKPPAQAHAVRLNELNTRGVPYRVLDPEDEVR